MFIRFILVGGIGFCIDAGLTYLLIHLTIKPWLARVPAILLAMIFTWLANRYFTYKVDKARTVSEAMNYSIVALMMAIINYLIYLLLVRFGMWPLAAVTLATAGQTLISFHAYRHFVFSVAKIKMTSDYSQQPESINPETNELIVSKSWYYDVGIFLAALAVLTGAMISLNALNSGLSGSDEGSHFLNGYLIWSYLTEAFGQNPLAYATDFYIHYPKISIGHWPPLYYVFLASFFFLLPHATFPFMLVNLFVAALPALLIARVVRQALGLPWAALAAFTYVLIPITLNNTVYLMLDQALTCLCLIAALQWSAYAKEPTLKRGLAYAAITATAILVKGNGWLLGVFPFFHIALTGNWRILFNWRTYVAGTLALSIVGVWTVVTFKISSDGFNYAWGLDYFILATSTFLLALYSNLGLVGVIAVCVGIAGSLSVKERPELLEMGRTGLAMVLATLLFHSIVPVDLDQRYMSSAIPFLAIFMAIGVWVCVRRWQMVNSRPWSVLTVAIAIFSIPGLLFLESRPDRFDLRMDLVAAQLNKQSGSRVVVIDGSPGAEGALTAEVVLRDLGRKSYVVRSSQLLAKSDFMGNRYTLRVNTPEAVLSLLDDISSSAVVVAEGPFIKPHFAHSDLILSALKHPSSPYQLKQTYLHHQHNGKTHLYMRKTPIPLQLEAVKRVNFPEKAPG
ncbi:GtrA family protein [Methylicorpusculum oleiharenae]|uniref:GtrA family protein n=1 Tax=Methylicorpusculum oleiharenae TaxID=1338687 RepID=UPI00135812BC|nr:GtrA family protein [Methylicorpusculum oleiharenae]MCD2451803.1 GtrA family protein [Methylicorpusculum oleiharenae]